MLRMSDNQNLSNHARFDPPFHFFAAPVFLANLIAVITFTVRHAMHHGTHDLGFHLWLVVLSIALVVLTTNTRVKDLKVQDRVIRLEERLRFAALLPPAEHAAASALTLRQIIALRFASDSELPALVRRTLSENLTPKQIKAAINQWRPDHHRV